MPAGYDEWKTRDPDDDRCEFCGARNEGHTARGWQPDECTGKCRRSWRDPNAENDARRDDDAYFARYFPEGGGDDA